MWSSYVVDWIESQRRPWQALHIFLGGDSSFHLKGCLLQLPRPCRQEVAMQMNQDQAVSFLRVGAFSASRGCFGDRAVSCEHVKWTTPLRNFTVVHCPPVVEASGLPKKHSSQRAVRIKDVHLIQKTMGIPQQSLGELWLTCPKRVDILSFWFLSFPLCTAAERRSPSFDAGLLLCSERLIWMFVHCWNPRLSPTLSIFLNVQL